MDRETTTIPLEFERLPEEEMIRRARTFAAHMGRRRSVRDFSDQPVPMAVVEACLRAAASAPSGANMQPWHFCVVTDPAVKRRIRMAAEEEEQAFYDRRASQEWLAALRPLGTDAHKPFLEIAPLLVAIFAQIYHRDEAGERVRHYYVNESVGIATGILIAALHQAGLACLTHTPSPMGFLNQILGRPACERPFLLLVVGYPRPDTRVPRIGRKGLEEFATFG